MSEEMTQQMMAAAERLATAAEALDRVLERIDAQQEALNAKVDRIVAAVEEQLSSVEAVGAAHIHGVPFDYAQGRLSTSFGWRLTSLRMTSELGWNVCRSLRSR